MFDGARLLESLLKEKYIGSENTITLRVLIDHFCTKLYLDNKKVKDGGKELKDATIRYSELLNDSFQK